LGSALRDLVIPVEVLAWLNEAVMDSDVTERAARDRSLTKLEEQHRHVESKLERLYDDRLDGRITTELYDKKAGDLRAGAADLRRRIEEMRAAVPFPVREAIDLMDLTSKAADLFAVQPVDEQQRFLRLVLKTGSWKDRQLRVEFDDPFEALRRSNQLSRTNQKENIMPKPQTEIWLPR
jgi:site-specific DNA recombinase